MTLIRFEQIKHFIHILDYTISPLYWYSKLEPLTSHIRKVSKSICISSSNISVDEIIVRFFEHSAHTVRIKNKLTPESYKILSLNKIERMWRKLRKTSLNAAKVRAVFENTSKKLLSIPQIIDDYNHHIGGIENKDNDSKKLSTQNQIKEITQKFKFIEKDIFLNGESKEVVAFGIEKTTEAIMKYYYWLKMRRSVYQYVTTCDECQRNKGRTHQPSGLLQPLSTPARQWE
ncbi:hypothetical protein Glove_464g14 [Diversispora epigaea]|uniref:Integrase zinc-binding domain-containing protein n=1 Tax=Diversispora epigaea TaxID=1348612 RepID=A0A397GRT8_9GLOM|nr:hypothetical protein Glove_464g14 [Diversispora epigaea]